MRVVKDGSVPEKPPLTVEFLAEEVAYILKNGKPTKSATLESLFKLFRSAGYSENDV